MTLRLFLSTDDSIPLHRRLIASFIEAIESARIEPGSLVPSTRELAQTQGLARATVSKAYSELVRCGYLVTRSGGKTWVAETLPGREVVALVALPERSDIDDLVSAYALRLWHQKELGSTVFASSKWSGSGFAMETNSQQILQ